MSSNYENVARSSLVALAALQLVLGCSCNGCSDRVASAQLPSDAARRYADRLCEAEAACGCEHYPSQEECRSAVITAFEAATADISSFDESCFDAVLDEIEARGCAGTAEVVLDCEAITGTASLGEACERDPRLRAVMPGGSCESGATCNLSTGLCSGEPSTDVSKQVGVSCIPHHLRSAPV